MTDQPIPIPPRSTPILTAPALMPQHTPMPDTTADDLAPVVILPNTDTVDPLNVRAHSRGNKITITIPDEILAVSELIGRPAADIVADLLAAQVAGIRHKAKGILGEVVL